MTDKQVFVLELVLSIIEMQFVLRYYYCVYGLPRMAKRLRLLALPFMLAITIIIRFTIDPIRPASLPLITILFSLLFLPFFHVRWEKKVLFSIILISVSFAWTILFDLLLTPLPNKNLWVVYISFHVGFWLLLELVKNIGKKENQKIPTSMWLLLSLIAAASCIVIASLQLNLWRRDDPYLLSTEVPVLLSFLIINVALFIFFDRFSELLKRDREQSLLRQQLSMQNEHYKQLAAYQDQIAALHHDMKNHINAAVSLVQNNAGNKEMLNYLQTVNGQLLQIEQTIETGNPSIDAVLNLKLSQLRYAGVQCEHEIHIPSDLPMCFEDSVVIFGNLLDNAREACENLPCDNRWVHITISYSNGAIYIKIDNPIPEHKMESNGSLLPNTTKADKAIHGYGLKNVNQVVEKRGTLRIDRENANVFSVRIMLYDL